MADDEREPNGVRYTTREMFDEIRRSLEGIRNELRTTRHDLINKLGVLSLRVDKLEHQHIDTLRRLEEHDSLAAEHLPKLEQLLTDQSFAERMKSAGFSRKTRWMAYGLFAFAFIGALGTIVSLIVLQTQGG